MKSLLIVLISFTMIACVNEVSMRPSNGDEHYFLNELSATKSPNGKIKLTLTEICYDSTSCHTQVFLDFGRTGSGVYATDGINLGIKAYWKGNDTIVVETKKEYKADQEWPEIHSLGKIVIVEYIKK